MNDINTLIEKRNRAWDAAKEFVEARRDSDGLLTDADAKTYAEMEARVRAFSTEIERSREMNDLDSHLAKPVSEPITNTPVHAEVSAGTGRASKAYKEDMLTALRTNFRKVSDVLQEGVDADGGYLVPDEYDSRLIDVIDQENVMRKLGTTITTSGQHKINIAAAKPAASWIEEGGALTFGDAKFDQVVLDAHKLHVAVKVTEELLYDSMFDLETYIIDQFGRALANAEEEAFMTGDGTNKPRGVFVPLDESQTSVTTTAGKITSDDVINLVYSLKRPYRKRAAFLLNDKTLAEVRKLKDNNGAYIWQPSYQSGEPDRLLGYPLYTSAYAPLDEAGSTPIAFGDFSYYNIGDRGTRSFQELRELFAGNGMIGYVAKERVDGKLVLPEAVRYLGTSGTSSNTAKKTA